MSDIAGLYARLETCEPGEREGLRGQLRAAQEAEAEAYRSAALSSLRFDPAALERVKAELVESQGGGE